MKRILYVLVFCLVFVSCSKDDDFSKENDMVTISFNQLLVSSNSMTRSDGNEFLDIIEEQTPDYVNVTLKNLDLDKTFTCKSNESITIPIGNYEIYAKYIEENAIINRTVLKTKPILVCKSFNYTIKPDTKNIILNTYYDCYAVFALIDECQDCTIDNEYSLPKYNKYFYGFFQKNHHFKVIPYNDSTEFITTTYNFSTTYDVNKVFAKYGKYYVIHPQQVEKTSCSFNVNITDMEEGEI